MERGENGVQRNNRGVEVCVRQDMLVDVPCDFIMLVEDDSDMRQDLAFLMQHRGYRVETAAHGKEALEKLALNGKPCMILLDLMMPVMDGWELRAVLAADDEFADVPVVLVSGIADIQEEAQSLQAIDYLTKPLDFERLYSLVDAHCPPH